MASNNSTSQTINGLAGIGGIASAVWGKKLAEQAAAGAQGAMAFQAFMAALSFYSVVIGMQGVMQGDIMSIISTGMSAFGLYVSVAAMGGPLAAAIVVAVAVVVGILIAVFGKHEDRGANQGEDTAGKLANQVEDTFVWTDWRVIPVAGVALAAMGIIGTNAPMTTQQILVPQTQLTQAVNQDSGVWLSSSGMSRYRNVLFHQGTGDDPSHVVIVSPGGLGADGKALDQVTTLTLRPHEVVTSNAPPGKSYTAFFITNPDGTQSINSAVVQGLEQQSALLQVANQSGTRTSQQATNRAAQLNKPVGVQ